MFFFSNTCTYFMNILFSAMSKFCEAIIEYCSNLETAPDSSVSKDRFSGEIASAFDILFNSWLISKEMKVNNYETVSNVSFCIDCSCLIVHVLITFLHLVTSMDSSVHCFGLN